jgi:hypothetical protein
VVDLSALLFKALPTILSLLLISSFVYTLEAAARLLKISNISISSTFNIEVLLVSSNIKSNES